MPKLQDVEIVPEQAGEEPMKQVVVWEEYFEKAEKLRETAETLTVTRTDDKEGMALARNTRLALKEIRVAATNRHKELKQDILVQGRKLDEAKNKILQLIEPLEARLLDQEQFAQREFARLQAELKKSREAEIAPFLFAPLVIDLSVLGKEEYDQLLLDTKAAHAARLQREEDQRREEAEKAEAVAREQKRLRLENIVLKREAAKKEEAARAEREAAELKARQEREVIEAKARKEREELETKMRVEREAREKAEKEVRDKKLAEEKAKAEQLKQEMALRSAPIKEKIRKFTNEVSDMEVDLFHRMVMTDQTVKIRSGIHKFIAWMNQKIEEIE